MTEYVTYTCPKCGFYAEFTNCNACDGIVVWTTHGPECTGCGTVIQWHTCRECGERWDI